MKMNNPTTIRFIYADSKRAGTNHKWYFPPNQLGSTARLSVAPNPAL
jgi:hypothetical protein